MSYHLHPPTFRRRLATALWGWFLAALGVLAFGVLWWLVVAAASGWGEPTP
jgi:hypothetical protein